MTGPTVVPAAEPKIRIGVSSCLLGDEVRFNGGHARHRYLTDLLGEFVDFVPVCPEVEVGMGVPRPSVRLELRADRVRMVDPKNGVDWTSAMEGYSRRRVAELIHDDLCGFVLKRASPSCGMERVKLYREAGHRKDGVGVFAVALADRYPLLPTEEEGRLNDPALRENFVERVFAYRRLKDAFAPRWNVGRIVAFHTREKLLLRAHDEVSYRELGRLVAEAKRIPRPAFAADYQERFMLAFSRRATVRKHCNVLQHITGFVRTAGDVRGRNELSEVIEDYRAGLVPLIVPITLVRHLARRHDQPLLLESSYLSPHPKELMLRNHS